MNIEDVIAKRHISYTRSKEVADICRPLFKAFNISAFNYSRIYPDDNSMLSLESNGESFRHFCKNHYKPSGTMLKSGLTMWEDYQPESLLQENARYFESYHGITIATPKRGYNECLNLAFKVDTPQVVIPFLNNLDVFEQFIFYFKDKASDLIVQAEQERIFLPKDMIGKELRPKTYKEFYESIITNKIYLDTYDGPVILSKREYEILLQFAFGRSTKEVGKALNISYRTVDCHLDNIKRKTKCGSRAQFVEMLKSNLLRIKPNL